MTSDLDWLQELKVGDPVAWGGNWANPPTKLLVARVTKAMVLTYDGQRWNRNHGFRVGSHRGSISSRISPWTAETEEKVERHELVGWLRRLASESSTNVSTDKLRRMRKAFDEAEREPEAKSEQTKSI